MTTDERQADNEADLIYLWRELKRRSREPCDHILYWTYFIVGTAIFGALGTWIELAKYSISDPSASVDTLISSVLTFFPALIGSTALQLVFITFKKGDSTLMSFAILAMAILFVLAIVLSIMSSKFPGIALLFGAICSVVSMWLWWITNADEQTYRRPSPPDAPSGGSTDRGLGGSLSGLQT